MVSQAVTGIRGVTVGQYGSIAVDPRQLDPSAPVTTDFDGGAFDGLNAFLEAADPAARVVKWQFVGPVTLGFTLMRAGLAPFAAFDVAGRAVRAHLSAIHDRIQSRLPEATQVVWLDEPMLTDLQDDSFPVPPDVAIDLVSSALALAEGFGVAGLHCCGEGDWASLLAAGPRVLSLPASPSLVAVAGYLGRFLDSGGWIAWGVIPTDGPTPMSAERPWRELAALWCSLVRSGCDPLRLRAQALVTPVCGLASHSESIAGRIARLTAEVSDRVRGQAVATRLTVGA
jgi:hypothetical protein